MGTERYRPDNLGSAYVNVKKGSPQEVIDEIKGAIEFLKSKDAYLSISMKNSDGSFNKMLGFFNKYKRDDQKDPDIIIRASTMSVEGTKPAYNKSKFTPKSGGYQSKYSKPQVKVAAKKQTEEDESFGGEEVPFA